MSLSQPVSWNRSCLEIQQPFHISHSVSCSSFKLHLGFLPPSLHLFSSCCCYNCLLVLTLLSFFDLGILFPSSQVPYGFAVCLLATLSLQAWHEFPFLQLYIPCLSSLSSSKVTLWTLGCRHTIPPIPHVPAELHAFAHAIPFIWMAIFFFWFLEI